MAGTSQECKLNKPGVYLVGERSGYWPESTFCNEEIVQVDCGIMHSAVLTETGRVFTWGSVTFGQLGLQVATDQILNPTHVASLAFTHIMQVACGDFHTLFLTRQGEIFACGGNVVGQLGLGHTSNAQLPTKVPGLARITRVATGCYHSVALTEEGEVWVTGLNDLGQTGLRRRESTITFVKVPNLTSPISDVACNTVQTALLSSTEEFFLSGDNTQTTLESVPNESNYCFKLIPFCSPVTAISGGGYNVAALTGGGRAWAWGHNDWGQLGTNDKIGRSVPYKMRDNISRIVVGYDQTALFTREGDVLVSGRSTVGKLGTANREFLVPTPLRMGPNLMISHITFAIDYSLLTIVNRTEFKPQSLRHLYPEITDKEKRHTSSLECPVCLKVMSAPIHLCCNGHSLCGACKDNVTVVTCPVCRGPFLQARNITLECLSADLELPCPYCWERMLVPALEGHADVCPSRQYCCPVQQSCGWNGQPEDMLAHCTSDHPAQTWTELSHLYVHRDFEGGVKKFIVPAFGNIFVVIFQFNVETGAFLAAMRFVRPPKDAHKFLLQVEFITLSEFSVTYRTTVCSCRKVNLCDNGIVLEGRSLKRLLTGKSVVCDVSVVNVDGVLDRVEHVKRLLEGTSLANYLPCVGMLPI